MLKQIYRATNRLLNTVGLDLVRTTSDLDSRLVDDTDVAELARCFASAFESWASNQQVFSSLQTFDVKTAILDFYREYLQSPYRDRSGGSRFNNALFLLLVARASAPSAIIDSGTYKGASAWALRLACPDVPIYSFDIDMSRLIRREPGVEYIESDWTSYDFRARDLTQALCYFDDHVDQIKRLLETADRRIPFAIFDDDYPITSFAEMANGGFSLPKIEFALDEYVARKKEVRWIERGQSYVWRVDAGYLERGRAVIASTERLPNTSLITGIHQTPYRVVALRRG